MTKSPRDPKLIQREFIEWLGRNGLLSLAVVIVSLIIGTGGFRWIVDEPWSLAFLNAAMLLGGMGPVGGVENTGTGGRIFAALFALFAGLVFLVITGLLLAPVFHRVLHFFHSEVDRGEQ
jgi:hypothetical protein